MVKLYDHAHAEAATPMMAVLSSVPFLRYTPQTQTERGLQERAWSEGRPGHRQYCYRNEYLCRACAVMLWVWSDLCRPRRCSRSSGLTRRSAGTSSSGYNTLTSRKTLHDAPRQEDNTPLIDRFCPLPAVFRSGRHFLKEGMQQGLVGWYVIVRGSVVCGDGEPICHCTPPLGPPLILASSKAGQGTDAPARPIGRQQMRLPCRVVRC